MNIKSESCHFIKAKERLQQIITRCEENDSFNSSNRISDPIYQKPEIVDQYCEFQSNLHFDNNQFENISSESIDTESLISVGSSMGEERLMMWEEDLQMRQLIIQEWKASLCERETNQFELQKKLEEASDLNIKRMEKLDKQEKAFLNVKTTIELELEQSILREQRKNLFEELDLLFNPPSSSTLDFKKEYGKMVIEDLNALIARETMNSYKQMLRLKLNNEIICKALIKMEDNFENLQRYSVGTGNEVKSLEILLNDTIRKAERQAMCIEDKSSICCHMKESFEDMIKAKEEEVLCLRIEKVHLGSVIDAKEKEVSENLARLKEREINIARDREAIVLEQAKLAQLEEDQLKDINEQRSASKKLLKSVLKRERNLRNEIKENDLSLSLVISKLQTQILNHEKDILSKVRLLDEKNERNMMGFEEHSQRLHFKQLKFHHFQEKVVDKINQKIKKINSFKGKRNSVAA